MHSKIDKSEQDEALTVNLMLRPLKHLLSDPDITEITINQPGEVWYKGLDDWQSEQIETLTSDFINSLITSVYSYNNMKEMAIGSLIMPDGSRCQIVRFPATLDGQVSFTVRKHSMVSFTLDELQEQQRFNEWRDVSFNKDNFSESNLAELTPKDRELLELKRQGDILQFLKKCVEYHKNIVIAGKTGSGKTTFAKALITEIPSSERIITIEDVHELHLPNHPNHLHMMFGSAKGRVSSFEALTSCMRLSPDRILLAELRGGETWEYLMSLNTGHPGGITTVHSNGAVHTFSRITQLVKSSEIGRGADLEGIKVMLYSTVDVVLYFERRKLKEVYFDPIHVADFMNK